MWHRLHNYTILLLITPVWLTAQESSRVDVWLTQLDYGIAIPAADLATRFGYNFDLGGGVAFLSRRGLYMGFDYDLLFGPQVKEDVLENLRSADGAIVGGDQALAQVFLRERGHRAGVQFGYLLDRRETFDRRGIMVLAGIDYFSHRVRIVDDFDALVQVQPPFDRGYDRFTAGWGLRQGLRYMHLSDNRLVNFYVQAEVMEAFTTDLRGYAYRNAAPVTGRRLDVLFGLELGWIIPIYGSPKVTP